MKPTQVPGRDFLFTVASNYPDEPVPEDMARQRQFIEDLAEVYPFEKMRTTFKSYLASHHPVPLDGKKQYQKWMYGLLSALSKTARVPILTYRGFIARVNYHASGCDKTSYRGVTCRRTKQGFRTKNRDRIRTHRIISKTLL